MSTDVTPPAPRAREAECHARDPLDLRDGVAALVARRIGLAHAAAEVDPAGQLAHDQQVDALEQRFLERRGVVQRRLRQDGPQVGEQAERLAQAQDRLLRTHLRGGIRMARRADRAEQHGIGRTGERERRRRQRLLARVHGRGPDRRFDELEVVAEARRDRGERAHGLGRDFRADAVAGQDGDARLHSPRFRSKASMSAACDSR